MTVAIGTAPPGFTLPDTTGQEWAPTGARATVVAQLTTRPVGCSIKWRDGRPIPP